ncbi:MAG: LytR/AlgR family response regulator transcription factor [Wenzhouxiangellaceae bacterium]
MNERPRLRVMVVDDEPPAVERMAALLADRDDAELVGCESRAARVIERCASLRPDVVLLDIEMPDSDGIEVARGLARGAHPPAVIFVTAHEQYAVDAFGVAALDYLVKPVRRDRLARALERAAGKRPRSREWIAGRIGERRVRIPLDEVRAFIAEDKCTLVYALHQQAMVDEPLKTLEQRHAGRFLRVHRNALVSRDHVLELFTDVSDVERVKLEGLDLRPEVSRRNRAAVRELLTRGS